MLLDWHHTVHRYDFFLGTFPLKADYTNYIPAFTAVLLDATAYVRSWKT